MKKYLILFFVFISYSLYATEHFSFTYDNNGCRTGRTFVASGKIAIATNIGTQVSGTPFTITVQAQNSDGTPKVLTSNMNFTVQVQTGTGVLTGNTGTILSGASEQDINITYTKVEGEREVALSVVSSDSSTFTNGTSNIFKVLAPEPSQASAISIDSCTQNKIKISWTNGNGIGRLVTVKTGPYNSINYPVDGNSYTANPQFGSGSQLGTASVVYIGSGNSVAVTNLQSYTQYNFRVFEFKGSLTEETVNYNWNSATNNPRYIRTSARIASDETQLEPAKSAGLLISNLTPNPAKDYTRFKITTPDDSEVLITLYTIDGRIVSEIKEKCKAGSQNDITIPLDKLISGSYIVSISAGSELIVNKIIVEK